MDNLKPRALRQEARRHLADSPVNPRHLILLNSGVVVILALIVNSLNFLLSHQISSTGGLGGLGMRSMLQTVQTMMSYAISIFTPFWTAGLLLCLVRLVRQEEFGPRTMLEGFRRFSRVLGFALLQSILMALLAVPVATIAGTLYTFTPFAASFMEAVQELSQSGALTVVGGAVDLTAIPPQVLMQVFVPLGILMVLVAVPVFLWVGYSLHLGVYLIMTDEVRSCFQAFGQSFRLMRGNRRHLLKLDLSYWWYYLLEAGILCIIYFDVIAELTHMALPIGPTALYFLVLVLYCICEMALHLWKKAEHDTAFVLAYEHIAHPERDVPGIAE